MLTKTKPRVIGPGITVGKFTDIEVVKRKGDWWRKSYYPILRTKEYKRMWRCIRAAHSVNNAVDMSSYEFMQKIAEFTRFVAVDKDDALRMLFLIEKVKTEQSKPSLIKRLERFKFEKELPF